MRVAGIGCREGVSMAEVLAAIDAARRARGVDALDALATAPAKRHEAALGEAARHLALPLMIAGAEALAAVEVATHSARSVAAAGTPSVSEAAALAVAGPGGRLLGPRLVLGRVTCAIAVSGERL